MRCWPGRQAASARTINNAGQVRYSSTLHGGESISFNDRKYSINVGNPSAVDIALDGINYGPHSDNSEPDTFTVESHDAVSLGA